VWWGTAEDSGSWLPRKSIAETVLKKREGEI
jgi:hypothetical protein